MTSPKPKIPEIRRRKADTITKSEHTMALSKHLTLTRSVAGTSHARPAQSSSSTGSRPGTASRKDAEQAGPLKVAGFPADKPPQRLRLDQPQHAGRLGRSQLESIEFADRHEDLVFGDPITARRVHRPHRPPRTLHPPRGRQLPQPTRPHGQTTRQNQRQRRRTDPG